MVNINISFSDKKDLEMIGELLSESGLPFKHIADPELGFFIAKTDSTLIGTIGLRKLDNIGLIRSLSVKESFKNNGTAKDLFKRIRSHAKDSGIEKLYLLTTTAEKYFQKLGFTKIDKADIPKPITNTIEYKKVCPKTSVCMLISI